MSCVCVNGFLFSKSSFIQIKAGPRYGELGNHGYLAPMIQITADLTEGRKENYQ